MELGSPLISVIGDKLSIDCVTCYGVWRDNESGFILGADKRDRRPPRPALTWTSDSDIKDKQISSASLKQQA